MDYNPPRKGGSNLREDPDLLRGVLASEDEHVVYPENVCLQCEREGDAGARCFHRHWLTTDEGGVAERRGTVVR